MILPVVFLILIFAFMLYTKVLDAQEKVRKAENDKKEKAEMKLLNLDSAGFSKYKLYKENSENLKSKCILEIKIPKISVLHKTEFLPNRILTYDIENGIKYWESNTLISYLFNCDNIVTCTNFEYKAFLKEIKYKGNFIRYCMQESEIHTLENLKTKTENIFNLYETKSVNYNQAIFKLAKDHLEPTLFERIYKVNNFQKEINGINKWLEYKYETGDGNERISEWGNNRTAQYENLKRKAEIENTIRLVYHLFQIRNN